MDLKKYEEALDNISELIISKYYNNNQAKYVRAKSIVIERFKNNDYEDILDPLPLFLPYFRKHFLYYCQTAPDFVGKVIYSFSNIPMSDIKHTIKGNAKRVFFIESKKKIHAADDLYKDIRKKLIPILDSPKIPNNTIKEILDLIESLEKVIYYKKAFFTYIRLLKDLRFSLQLLYNVNDLEKMYFPNKNLVDAYPDILRELGGLTRIEYSELSIVHMMIEDLYIVYNKIEECHPKPKTQDRVSDSGSIENKPTDIDNAVGLLGHIEDLTWDKITITLTSLDTIRLTTGDDYKKEHHYSSLGMDDKRKKGQSDGTWRLLSLFAINNGTVTSSEIDETRNYSSPKKAVSTLQKKLKQVIGLQDNPIENHESKVGYKAKLYFRSEIPKQFHGSDQQIDKINALKGE